MPRRNKSLGDLTSDSAGGVRSAASAELAHGLPVVPLSAELASAAELTAFNRTAAARTHARNQAIQSLSTALAEGQARWAKAQARKAERLEQRALQRDQRRESAYEKARARLQRDVVEEKRTASALLARGQRRGLWRDAVILSALPLHAVYGRTNLNHNLTLLMLSLVWVFGEELTDALSGPARRTEPERSAPWWFYSAPLVNLLAGWWLLHERQHERLITGLAQDFKPQRAIAALGPALSTSARSAVERSVIERGNIRAQSLRFEDHLAIVDLSEHVAPDFVLDAMTLQDVAALATVLQITWNSALPAGTRPEVASLSARVVMGKLHLRLRVSACLQRGFRQRILESVKVAWFVQVLE